jgi:hypothetical protein
MLAPIENLPLTLLLLPVFAVSLMFNMADGPISAK